MLFLVPPVLHYSRPMGASSGPIITRTLKLPGCSLRSFIITLLSELVDANISLVKARNHLRKYSNLAKQVYLVGKASADIIQRLSLVFPHTVH